MRRRSKLSTFKRPPAGICDPEASYSDFTCAHPHDLTTRCGAPIVDQVGYHGDSKPMGEQLAPEQPRSPTAASISSARRCSALRWGSRGVTVTMCDVVGIAGKAQGGKSGVMGVLLRTFQAYLARLSLTVAWPT
jgi:hypothetical protein